MGTSAEFWRDQSKWPRDTSEMIFLGRAVEEFGRALLSDDKWSASGFAAEHLVPLNYSDLRMANNFVARHLPALGRREYRGSMAPPPISPVGQLHVEYVDHRPTFGEITSEERDAVREFLERHNSQASIAKERAAQVANAFADLAIEGKLRTTYRSQGGGEFCPVLKEWWNTERLEPRFAFCTINLHDPFSSKSGSALIYVSRADLGDVVRRMTFRARGTQKAEDECTKWLDEQFRLSPKGRTKADYQAEAERLFGIGTKAFLRSWAKAAPSHPERSRAGPKPKFNRST